MLERTFALVALSAHGLIALVFLLLPTPAGAQKIYWWPGASGIYGCEPDGTEVEIVIPAHVMRNGRNNRHVQLPTFRGDGFQVGVNLEGLRAFCY